MSGFLEDYGVSDERRARRTKKILLAALALVVVGTILFFTFRTWRQERAVKHFLECLRNQDYKTAYQLWGCTDATPCRYYPYEKFLEDWGPKSPHADAAAASIDDVDPCGDGVVFSVTFPKTEPVSLWVERSTNVIGFAPWPECPGRHWRFKEFLRRVTGRG